MSHKTHQATEVVSEAFFLGRSTNTHSPNRAFPRDVVGHRARPGRIDQNVPDLLQRDFSATEPNRVWGTSTVESALVKRPESRGAILHSDYGSQYTSHAYRQCLQRLGLQISMGRVRTCADNASAESVFGQLKRELVRRRQFRTRQEAIKKINHYFLNLYNPWRRPPLLSKKPTVIHTDNSRKQNAFC